MSREALVLLVCCCDFRDGAERLIPSKSLGNAVIRAFPGLFRILRMCAPRRAAAVVRPRERKKSADRRRRILISRLLIIRASVPRRKSPFPAYFKGFPAVSPLIPPYPAFLKYPVSPHLVHHRHSGVLLLPHQLQKEHRGRADLVKSAKRMTRRGGSFFFACSRQPMVTLVFLGSCFLASLGMDSCRMPFSNLAVTSSGSTPSPT